MVPALGMAACGGGGDGAAVEGTFASGLAPTGVWVVESERSEPADSAGFRLADLTPGPVSLRLMNGSDTAAILNVSGLAPGARLRLEGLRVDRESGMAFPRTVQLDGGDVVTVNGLRMGPASRVPRAVDLRGAVLAWSSDAGALLVRPDDPRIPDLRVVVGVATELVGEDGGVADVTMLAPGDSVRVEGRSQDGYVLASRVIVPSRIATLTDAGDDVAVASTSEDAGGADERGGTNEGGGANEGGGPVARVPTRSATPAPVARAPARSPTPAPVVRAGGRPQERPGRGRGRDKEPKGKGKGKG